MVLKLNPFSVVLLQEHLLELIPVFQWLLDNSLVKELACIITLVCVCVCVYVFLGVSFHYIHLDPSVSFHSLHIPDPLLSGQHKAASSPIP